MSLPSSPVNSPVGGPYRKPRADLYTMLLLISLAALVAGIVCLFMDVKDYPSKPPYTGAPTVSRAVDSGPPGLALAGRDVLGLVR